MDHGVPTCYAGCTALQQYNAVTHDRVVRPGTRRWLEIAVHDDFTTGLSRPVTRCQQRIYYRKSKQQLRLVLTSLWGRKSLA